MVSLGVDYLPPETDAVRLRVKVLKGRFTMAVGGPTVYFGHSDVTTQAVTLDAATHGEWSTVEWSFHQGLTRNFRRSQWARNSPIICYTRWIQEPLGIEVAAGSTGEVLIDQIELLAHGQGRPYPTFEPAAIRTVAPGIDFEDPASMEKAFTVMTDVTEQPSFEQAPHLVRKGWVPPRIARVGEGRTGRHSLEMVMTGTEEVCFAGLRILGTAEANAVALTLKAEYAGVGKPGVVLDFLAYAAPPEQRRAFPWDGLRPPPSWRNSPEIAFTYYLSPRSAVVEPVSFGFYHIRRIVPNNAWVTLVLPLADFICNYGQGAMLPAFQKQAPLAGDNVLALTLLSYFGQNSKPVRVLIDEVKFVTVPGTPAELRSFYQTPVPKNGGGEAPCPCLWARPLRQRIARNVPARREVALYAQQPGRHQPAEFPVADVGLTGKSDQGDRAFGEADPRVAVADQGGRQAADVRRVTHPRHAAVMPRLAGGPLQERFQVAPGAQLVARDDRGAVGQDASDHLCRFQTTNQGATDNHLGREFAAGEQFHQRRKAFLSLRAQRPQIVVGPARIAVLAGPGVANDEKVHGKPPLEYFADLQHTRTSLSPILASIFPAIPCNRRRANRLGLGRFRPETAWRLADSRPLASARALAGTRRR